jgi:uncharacterized protein YggE
MPKNMMKLHKSVQMTLIISVAVVILAVIGVAVYKYNSSSNTIKVNGQAIAKVSPDLISVYFSVETKGSTSKAAEDANTAIVSKLEDNIVALGFKESDLTTENYNIYPDYDYKAGKTTGYRALHSLKIELLSSQKDKISDVIDAGTDAGAGISYINFELSPALQQTAKTAAIKNASDDAKVKAEAIAAGFSKQLGRLVSVSLDEFNYSPWPIYATSDSAVGSAESAKAAVRDITPSNQDVSAYVTAVYKLR